MRFSPPPQAERGFGVHTNFLIAVTLKDDNINAMPLAIIIIDHKNLAKRFSHSSTTIDLPRFPPGGTSQTLFDSLQCRHVRYRVFIINTKILKLFLKGGNSRIKTNVLRNHYYHVANVLLIRNKATNS